ncbi:hypothetical protein CF15_00085 [Pyrodictium occultum]|uniref:Uncharacterized protein n=1 Tax=Pyrodictium occultum TaxID=2309 RepID=A0A0V8RTL1_PYROC|nr:hypothetical protein [Pyrodictium occultum]KSW11309.1 hypothetical protein CF15_00085 [Pyrodictium occultum]
MGETGEIPYRAKRMIVSEAPRGGITLAGVLASLSSLVPLLLLNMGARTGLVEDVFAALYLSSLPVVASGVYQLYRLALSISEACGLAKPSGLVFAVGAAPLGYVVPIYYTLYLLSRCDGLKGRVNATPLDIMLNLITFGLHSALYASLFNKVLDNALKMLGRPY